MGSKAIYQAGMDGENQAEAFLCSHGMELVARRIRYGTGEIDLVMQQGETLVFVEVKYRPGDSAGAGLKAISPGKIRRTIDCARHFLTQRDWLDRPVRFDALEITRDGILHIPNAFQA